MRTHLATLIPVILLFTSCATLSRNGVGRIKRYTIESNRLPDDFDGYSIAFLSDTHYPSKFTRKRLGRIVRKLRETKPQLLLLGGDYVTSNEYLDELFDSISTVETRHGIYAVPGNHDFRHAEETANTMHSHGIRLLEDETTALKYGNSQIMLTGIGNPFKTDSLTQSPSASVADSTFTILLTHTPDYAEDVDAPADLVFAGHTHGGQISLFGIFTPVTNSRYGTRFIRGLNHTDHAVPVITTTGVGTSRKNIRFCVPSEIILVTLKKTTTQNPASTSR